MGRRTLWSGSRTCAATLLAVNYLLEFVKSSDRTCCGVSWSDNSWGTGRKTIFLLVAMTCALYARYEGE